MDLTEVQVDEVVATCRQKSESLVRSVAGLKTSTDNLVRMFADRDPKTALELDGIAETIRSGDAGRAADSVTALAASLRQRHCDTLADLDAAAAQLFAAENPYPA